ncbi:DUF2461 domain-containing protein [Mucilaginibacter sp. RS28]|uniref:DUF2461 domain-containing protein n=1 Tax=Mucilaginibacter straminoryzae TaxID=2932774 RepID=A0A9X1X633_9SPHI|nr:DUF2461 domain-containing protein [Mucilaginibacter straminoryzae]MCJ8211613.1 DUF2461 domain-containing protein [Mucilaginibacter straminoryzae]
MISQSALDFIKEVAENNNREWFMDNKPLYEESRENMLEFTAALLTELGKTDPVIALADPKKALQRIYRDVRFSKDKSPYKDHWGIGLSSNPSKPDATGYYIHIKPQGSFVGGGYWQPTSEHIKAIRQEIDYNGAELKEIIDDKEFVKLFGDFRKQNQLKTLPKGYEADHPDISLLKLKDFIAMHDFKDAELVKPDSYKRIAGVLAKIYPLNQFLNNAIS